MTSTARMVLVLAGICCVAGLALAGVYEITKEPIAYQKKLEVIRSLKAVLPDLDVDPDTFFLDLSREDGSAVRVFHFGKIRAGLPAKSLKGILSGGFFKPDS